MLLAMITTNLGQNYVHPQVLIVIRQQDESLAHPIVAMKREAIVANILPISALPVRPTRQTTIVLGWFPTSPTQDELDSLVHWVHTAGHPVGLIGCEPLGPSQDNERALAAGFDDFVTGQISIRELCGRIRALTRRMCLKKKPNEILRFGELTLDRNQHELWVRGQATTLTRREVAVLVALMEANGGVRSRSDLLNAAWGEKELDISERAVDNVVLRLRRKVGVPNIIVTLRSAGFRLASPHEDNNCCKEQ